MDDPQRPIGGLYRKAYDDEELTSIDMGETRFVPFGPKAFSCVGTQGLAGCTAVMIVSAYAVIMSHIPPTADVDPFMDTIEWNYNQHRQWFLRSSSTIVGASFDDLEVFLIGPKADIIQARFQRMGLFAHVTLYDANQENQEFAGRGTVLIDSRGPTVDVYIEDRLVERIAR